MAYCQIILLQSPGRIGNLGGWFEKQNTWYSKRLKSSIFVSQQIFLLFNCFWRSCLKEKQSLLLLGSQVEILVSSYIYVYICMYVCMHIYVWICNTMYGRKFWWWGSRFCSNPLGRAFLTLVLGRICFSSAFCFTEMDTHYIYITYPDSLLQCSSEIITEIFHTEVK